nr:MAG TPA: E2 glycoprotein [Caudoviricetes sp.]
MRKEEFSQMLKQIIGESPDSETLTVSGLYDLVDGYDLFDKEDVVPEEAPEVGEDGVAKTGEIVNLTSETIQAWTTKFDELETTIQDIYSRLSRLESLVSAVDDVNIVTVPTTEVW